MIDVAVVQDRLSAYFGTRVPREAAHFLAWLAESPRHAALLEERTYLLPAHPLEVADPAAALPTRSSGRYHHEPPEFMALVRTGCDGEQIGLLELAPELAREKLPYVTFFPMEFTLEVCALGDDLPTALTMYRAYPNVDGARPLKLPEFFGHTLPAVEWNGYAAHTETPPRGYRFVAATDRVGVLAPADAFSPTAPVLSAGASESEIDAALEQASALLAAGYPGSALAAARSVRYVTLYPDPRITQALHVWHAAATALGRPWHAEMVAEALHQLEADSVPQVIRFSGTSFGFVHDDDSDE